MAIPKTLPIHSFYNESFLRDKLSFSRYLIAIDEVGRGCLAGPVVTVASLWDLHPIKTREQQKYWLNYIKDSKAMTEKARELAFEKISLDFCLLKDNPFSLVNNSIFELDTKLVKSSCNKILFEGIDIPNDYKQPVNPPQIISLAIGSATPVEIDNLNIWGATQLAMGRAITNLHDSTHETNTEILENNTIILVDGKMQILVPELFKNFQQVVAVGGDGAFVSVGFSSVVAKVLRDSYMVSISKNYSVYGFEKHKGYATKQHREALGKYKASDIHRRSFLNSNFLP